jgi:hypothetical protein
MDPKILLLEVEDLHRTMPPRATIRHDTEENAAWWGRAGALVDAWDPMKGVLFQGHAKKAMDQMAVTSTEGIRLASMLLQQMRADLAMKTRGPLSATVDRGMTFDYFDAVRKLIETAREDILFVDPYLDADFVSRYLPHVAAGTSIRLLTKEKLSTLMPAVRTFAHQESRAVEVRAATSLHDRFVFIDGRECHQSGASFKDGGKNAPTTLTQIVDSFAAVRETYEVLWTAGAVQL